MRISGLASGMDIDSIVEKLMQAERIPLDKLEQQKQTYEWTRDAYRDVNTKLQTFDTYIRDNLLLKSFHTKAATSSNPDLVGVTATSSASGSISIDGVSQLAAAARAIGGNTNVNGTDTLEELFNKNGVALPTENFYIGIKAIQKDGTLSEETQIEYTLDMTVDEFVKKLNNSSAGVTAIFENGKLSITAKNTGDVKNGAEIVVTSGVEVFKAFNMPNTESIVDPYAVQTLDLATNGKNAEFTINGITTERASNTFSINGYSISLKQTFDNSTSPVTLTSTTNVDDIVSKIKEFVDTYNGLVKEFNDKIKESKYRDYPPLTKAQREELDEKEIEKWEEKAKSGLLRGDSIIRDGLSKMRALVYETNTAVNNPKYNTLFSIGITTTKNYNDGGTLELDEEKLKKALEEDPDAVATLFTNNAAKSDGTSNDRGYFLKLRDEMANIKEKIEKKAGRSTMTENQYTIGKSLRDIEKRINTWTDKLKSIEDRYWKQFTAMEKAINRANMQASMFMPQY